MQWPTTVAGRGAVPLLNRRKMHGCSSSGCSARSNRLCENGCPDFSLLLLLGADEQIFGVNEQILGPDQSDQWASACPWWWHRPTDARVIAGTVLGVASMFARRHW